MRLKEPLYGLRVAQMHVLVHLGFAINMILIEKGVISFSEPKLKNTNMIKSSALRMNEDQCIDYDERKAIINSFSHEQVITEPIYNKTVCHMLFAAHCISVIFMIVEKILKKYRLLLVCSNFLRTVPINLFYLTTMIYCIYKNRIDCRYSDILEEYTYEIWIQYEI